MRILVELHATRSSIHNAPGVFKARGNRKAVVLREFESDLVTCVGAMAGLRRASVQTLCPNYKPICRTARSRMISAEPPPIVITFVSR